MKRLFRGLKSLWQIVWEVVRRVHDSDMRFLVGSLAFASIIAIVPLMAVSLSVFLAYGGMEGLVAKIEPFLLQNFVEASGTQASRYIRTAIDRIHSGALGAGGVIAMLFVSTRLFSDMETAVQRIWKVEAGRSFIRRWVVYWLVIFLGPLVLAGLLGAVSSRNVGLAGVLPKEAIGLTFVFGSLFLIYKLVPNCKVNLRAAFWSSVGATFAIWVAQDTYILITRKLLRYNKIYGSLASVPIFLIWLAVLWWICLTGVALTTVLHQRFQPAAKSRATKTRQRSS